MSVKIGMKLLAKPGKPSYQLGEHTLGANLQLILLSLMFHKVRKIIDLIETVWPNPDDEPEGSEDVIVVNIYRLNKILSEYGWRICSRGYGWGYSLEQLP